MFPLSSPKDEHLVNAAYRASESYLVSSEETLHGSLKEGIFMKSITSKSQEEFVPLRFLLFLVFVIYYINMLCCCPCTFMLLMLLRSRASL